MKEEIIYTYILIKEDGTYLGWSKSKEVKEAGNGMQWIEWNKPLPNDIETKQYVYEDGELKAVEDDI